MIWCLNQFKDFIPKFPLGGSFFSEKEFLNLYTIIHFSFPLIGCVNDVVKNPTNYQEYKYLNFLQYHTLTVIHFMNIE